MAEVKDCGRLSRLVAAEIEGGALEHKPLKQIAKDTGASASYVSVMVHRHRRRLAAEADLPKLGPLPDDTPLRAIRYMMPARAWHGLMRYGWMFKEAAPLKVLRDTPDDMMLAMPQIGQLALEQIREKSATARTIRRPRGGCSDANCLLQVRSRLPRRLAGLESANAGDWRSGSPLVLHRPLEDRPDRGEAVVRVEERAK